MKRILSVFFSLIFVAVCMVAGSIVLTGNGLSKIEYSSDTSQKNGDDETVTPAATGNWSSYYASSYAGGSGSSTNPYLISTPEQLARMAYRVNNNYDTSSYFKLTADIDISAHYWTAIGVRYAFRGNFNGDDYTIIGMTINSGASGFWGDSDWYCASFFGWFNSATIASFSLSRANISWSCSGRMPYSAFVVSRATDGTSSIKDVRVVDSYLKYSGGASGTTQSIGGIAGLAGPVTIQRCCVVGSEVRTSSSVSFEYVNGGYDSCAGGLVGEINGTSTIEDCFFSGHFDCYTAVGGGLVGRSDGSVNIRRCYFVDTLTFWAGCKQGGGLVGAAYAGINIRSCFCYYSAISLNSSSISGTTSKGPLIGYIKKGAALGSSTASSFMFYSMWYSSSSSSSWYGTMEGSGNSNFVGNKSYTNASLPKTGVTDSFYTSTSYLGGSDTGWGSSWSASTWVSTNSNRATNGYPILNGSCVSDGAHPRKFVSSSFESSFGGGIVTYKMYNYQASSANTSPESSSGNSVTPFYVIYGQTFSLSASPASGYTFHHWANVGGTQISTSSSTTTIVTKSSHGTYDGYFRGNAYTLTYDANGGSVSPSSKTIYYQEAYGALATPTRTNYDFVGWYTAATGGTAVSSSTTLTSMNNVTIYAHWTLKKYTITVNMSGAGVQSVSGGGTYEYGTKVTISATAKPGYTVKWTDGVTTASRSITVTANKTYTATATANEYNVTFNYNGMSLSSSDITVSTADFSYQGFMEVDGYWTSGNKETNSFSYAYVGFQTMHPNQEVVFDCINSGEIGCDFGMLSNLDVELSQDTYVYEEDCFYHFGYAATVTTTQKITYVVQDPGDHFITIKYIKDGSNAYGQDCFKFRLCYGVDDNQFSVRGQTVPFVQAGSWWIASNTDAVNDGAIALAKVTINNVQYSGQRFYVFNRNTCSYTGSDYFYASTSLENILNSNYSRWETYPNGDITMQEITLPSGQDYFWLAFVFPASYNSLGYEETFMFTVSEDDTLPSSFFGFAYDKEKTNSVGSPVYSSTNRNIDNSYAWARIWFTTEYDGQEVSLVGANFSGYNEDYGMFGHLDTELQRDEYDDGDEYESFQGESEGDWREIVYYVDSAGTHFIDVKFIKDGNGSYFDDCFSFFSPNTYIQVVADGEMPGGQFVVDTEYSQYVGYLAYKSTNHTDDSRSKVRVYFTTEHDGQTVLFVGRNSGEQGCDYGVFGNIDEPLLFDSGNYFYSFDSSGDGSEEEVEYYVDYAGEHFIEVAYIKDGSQSYYDDCFRFFAVDIDISLDAENGFSLDMQFSYDMGREVYQSTNHGNPSYSLAKIHFITEYSGQTVVFAGANFSGFNEDYGMFGFLDQTLPADNYPSGDIYVSCQGYGEGDWQYAEYQIENPGEHFIYVKFIKDDNGSYFDDCFRFYLEYSDADMEGKWWVENIQSGDSGLFSVETGIPYYVDSGASSSAKLYTFSLGSDGYYVSGNKGVDTSFAAAKVTFRTSHTNQAITFQCRSYGESSHDYGIMSALDVMLPFGNDTATSTSSTVYYTFYGKSSSSYVYVTYIVPTAGEHFITIKYIKDGSVTSYDDTFKFRLYGNNVKHVTFGSAYGTLPTPTRTGYTFGGWWTSSSGGTQKTSSTTYSTAGNETLYAHWTPTPITVTVHIMAIGKSGADVNESTEGGQVAISRYVISGTTSSKQSATQTTAKTSYTVHSAQLFQMTATAKTGYIFVGYSTASTPSSSIKNPSSAVSTTASYYPSSNTDYYVYFKQTSPNLLKYDDTDKYFYFEDGYYPQSEATVAASTLNASAVANGEKFTYNNGTKVENIPVYTYGGDRYVKVTSGSTTKWFKFEPIRWRISDYGIAKTDRSATRYKTLSLFKGYASFASNFVVVSDLILGVGSMSASRTAAEGDSVTSMSGFTNVQNTADGCELNFSYAQESKNINVQNYSTYAQGDVVHTGSTTYSAPLRIASVEELDSVGFANKRAKASDMVAFILGLDKEAVSYWTRDLSNLGAGVAISASGTQIRPWLDQLLGIRFAYNFSEGSCNL